jgi:tetratricopeptide (TPR) repeat protein
MRQLKRGHYEEDEFQSTMEKAIKFIVRHRDTSIFIGAVIVIGIGALIYLNSRGEQRQPEADVLHTQAMGLIGMRQYEDAENILLELTERYPKTRPGKIGFYYLGILYFYTGRFQQALDSYDEFIKRASNDYILTPAALLGAGGAAEGLKEYDKAHEYYERATKDKESPFYHLAMLSYGRTTGILGNKEEAINILQELLEQESSQNIAADAKFYIGFFSE